MIISCLDLKKYFEKCTVIWNKNGTILGKHLVHTSITKAYGGPVAKYQFHCRILTHFGYTRKRIQSSDEKLDAAIREVHQEKGEESIGMRRMTYILRYIVHSTY